jgi:hypothetical protein
MKLIICRNKRTKTVIVGKKKLWLKKLNYGNFARVRSLKDIFIFSDQRAGSCIPSEFRLATNSLRLAFMADSELGNT